MFFYANQSEERVEWNVSILDRKQMFIVRTGEFVKLEAIGG